MPVSHVQSVAGGATPTTSDSIVIPTVQVNDLLVLFCTNKGATAAPTVGDDDGGTWTRLDNGGANGASVWWRRATAATSGKTVTASGFTTGCKTGLSVYRGVVTSGDPWENRNTASQASGTESIAGFTPSRYASMICLAVFHRGANITNTTQTCTNPGNLAERFDVTNASQACSVMLASEAQVAAGATGTISWVATNSAHITTVFNLLAEVAQPARSMHQNRMRRAA